MDPIQDMLESDSLDKRSDLIRLKNAKAVGNSPATASQQSRASDWGHTKY